MCLKETWDWWVRRGLLPRLHFTSAKRLFLREISDFLNNGFRWFCSLSKSFFYLLWDFSTWKHHETSVCKLHFRSRKVPVLHLKAPLTGKVLDAVLDTWWILSVLRAAFSTKKSSTVLRKQLRYVSRDLEPVFSFQYCFGWRKSWVKVLDEPWRIFYNPHKCPMTAGRKPTQAQAEHTNSTQKDLETDGLLSGDLTSDSLYKNQSKLCSLPHFLILLLLLNFWGHFCRGDVSTRTTQRDLFSCCSRPPQRSITFTICYLKRFHRHGWLEVAENSLGVCVREKNSSRIHQTLHHKKKQRNEEKGKRRQSDLTWRWRRRKTGGGGYPLSFLFHFLFSFSLFGFCLLRLSASFHQPWTPH